MFKREGGAFGSGNSILMQRERGNKKRQKQKRNNKKVRAIGKISGTEAGEGRRVEKSRTANEKAKRDQAEQQTGESKR